MIDRQKQILKIVNDCKRIEVVKLAKKIGVSQVTTRKDLDLLEERGLLEREHGYAVILGSDDINNRLAFKYDIKKKIAFSAADLVSDGETVMIESGSSCTLLADEIASKKRDVTIVTNSAFIASYIRKKPFARIVLLGGDYQAEAQVLCGPLAKKCAKEFFVDKLFVGTDGFSPKVGFTGINHLRTEIVRAMAENASKVVILTESSKFAKQGVVAQFSTKEVNYVFTDNKIPLDIKNNLIGEGVIVKTVSTD